MQLFLGTQQHRAWGIYVSICACLQGVDQGVASMRRSWPPGRFGDALLPCEGPTHSDTHPPHARVPRTALFVLSYASSVRMVMAVPAMTMAAAFAHPFEHSVRVPLRGEKQHAARDIDDRVLGVQPVLQ